jgi:hypothetical protein
VPGRSSILEPKAAGIDIGAREIANELELLRQFFRFCHIRRWTADNLARMANGLSIIIPWTKLAASIQPEIKNDTDIANYLREEIDAILSLSGLMGLTIGR